MYTYPVARAPRLQGKLVVQARSKKEKSRGKKEGEKRKGKKGRGKKVLYTRPALGSKPGHLLTCPPYPIALHGPQQAAIGRRRATGCTIRARPV